MPSTQTVTITPNEIMDEATVLEQVALRVPASVRQYTDQARADGDLNIFISQDPLSGAVTIVREWQTDAAFTAYNQLGFFDDFVTNIQSLGWTVTSSTT